MSLFSPRLMHGFLRVSARRYPEKIALVSGDERISYGSLDSASGRLAGALRGIGLKRHDRVVVFLDNSPESVISLFGILKAGGAFVILNGTLKAKKLNYILRDSGASALITHVRKRDVVTEAVEKMPSPVRTIWVGEPSAIPGKCATSSCLWEEFIRQPAPEEAGKGMGFIDQDLAALIYTSGSTGDGTRRS